MSMTPMNNFFQFTELAVSDMTNAPGMKWDDFKDALQAAAAERVHADSQYDGALSP